MLLFGVESFACGKNRLIIHGGVGRSINSMIFINTDNNAGKSVAVGGLTYERKLNDKLVVTGSALVNNTYLLGVGVDF